VLVVKIQYAREDSERRHRASFREFSHGNLADENLNDRFFGLHAVAAWFRERQA
jgi:hypothetical protein